MRPIDWRKELLARHQLDKPDGRPLYRYRLIDSEYDSLKQVVVDSSSRGIYHARGEMLHWDSLFVFYGSEWWRRHYSGKWGWEGVLTSIGLTEEISIGQRNAIVELGLARWNREVRVRGGQRHFLGTVATEGGLPLNQLAGGSGWLKNILSVVIERHISTQLPISELLEAHSSSIPRSYRSKEVGQILEDIANSVIALREECNLAEKNNNALDWLDKNRPDWWHEFPLPLNNQQARDVLNELISVAGKTKTESRSASIELERYLVNAETSPVLVSNLTTKRYIRRSELEELGLDQFHSKFDVFVVVESGQEFLWCAVVKVEKDGREYYRFGSTKATIPAAHASEGVSVVARKLGEKIGSLLLPNASTLETDIPWTFKRQGDKWYLIGTASQTLADEQCLLYVPQRLEVEKLTETTQLNEGAEYLEGTVRLLKGRVKLGSDEEIYNVKTGASDSYIKYTLRGRKLVNAVRPADIFTEIPTLYSYNSLTGRTLPDTGVIAAKPLGVSEPWRSIRDVDDGVYEVRKYDSDKNVVWRRRIGLFPGGLSSKLNPDRNSTQKGVIEIEGCGAHTVTVADQPDISSAVTVNDEATLLHLEAEEIPPLSVAVSILPKGHRWDLNFSLPFPARGALLYDSTGNSTSFRQRLFLNDLYGYRLRVFEESATSNSSGILRFELVDGSLLDQHTRDMYVSTKLKIGNVPQELSVISWLGIIRDLLGASTNLDAFVRVSFIFNGSESFKLDIGRYQYSLEPDFVEASVALTREDSSSLDLQSLEAIDLCAMRLQQPEQKPLVLQPEESGFTRTGKWMINTDRMESGAWMIIPANDKVSVRPMLWIKLGESDLTEELPASQAKTLQQAIRFHSKEEREEALRKVMNEMAGDFQHKSWDYLAKLWGATQHLPINTFDVWVLAVSEPKFLAALTVNGNFSKKGLLLNKMTDELPIVWALVRVIDWVDALLALRETFPVAEDEEEAEVVDQILISRIESISTISTSLIQIAHVLKREMFDIESEATKLMRMPFEGVLGHSVTTLYEKLKRTHADDSWPEVLDKDINDIVMQGLPEKVRTMVPVRLKHQVSVAMLPVILAWRANTDDDYGWMGQPVNLFKLEMIADFDRDWFDRVFGMVVAWLHEQNKVRISADGE